MFPTKLAAITALYLAMLPAAVSASEADGSGCALRAHRVTAVAPYRTGAHIGKPIVNQVRGATIYVEAERHMSAEWLEKELRRHLVSMSGPAAMADCPFDVEGVRVRVQSRGPGYVVTLTAKDAASGREVLRRARLLLG
jgi:hypothetical protein